jgi:hypothetical protein
MALALEGCWIGLRYGRSTCGGKSGSAVEGRGGGGHWVASRAFYGRFGGEEILIFMLKIEPRIFGRGPIASQFSR